MPQVHSAPWTVNSRDGGKLLDEVSTKRSKAKRTLSSLPLSEMDSLWPTSLQPYGGHARFRSQ